MVSANIRRLTKKETAPARKFANNIILELNKIIKQKNKNLRYNVRRVGSAGTNTIVCDKDGKFDLDYQLVLSPKVNVKDPTNIKNIFDLAMREIVDNTVKVENSTSVITVRTREFSIDFAIVSFIDNILQIIRRNAQDDNQHQYTWDKLKAKNAKVYEIFKRLDYGLRKDICDEVISRKIKSKQQDSDKPSFSHFIDIINERGLT